MKKIGILLLVFFLLLGCTNGMNQAQNDIPKENDKEENLEDRVEKMLESMTLEEKIGQMMIVFYRAPQMDQTLKSALEDVKPGGFILFKENITTYENTLDFIKQIKATSKIPMFISIDQEGGNVQRLLALQDKQVTNIPYMQQLGNTNDPALAKELGKVMAEELRVFGINMNFAPVLDVYSNPQNTVIGKRAFGTTSEVVTTMGLALGKSLEENGIIPVYKHFPGHGNTSVDSHIALPIVTKTKEELYELDIIPFQKAIEEKAPVMMIGHLAVPEITKDHTPASLSKTLITNFLKEELKYDGLVITDALNMKALTNNYSEEEIYVQAINAGVDILLMPSSSRRALQAVKEKVEKGIISEERIDESVRKILLLKYEKIEKYDQEYLTSDYLNSKEHQEVISKILN